MSSHYGAEQGYSAELCIDGNVADGYASQTLCHSTVDTNATLRVGLNGTHSVTYVEIYNRVGRCGMRLGYFEIWLETATGERSRCASENEHLDGQRRWQRA